MRQTYIATPFALSGDKTPIPGPVDLTGAVSYTQGWGIDYERELGVDSLAKPVSRGVNNYLFNVITTAIKAYQEQAWPEWIAPADNGGTPVGYAAGTVVTVATNPVATRQWVSLVDNNTSMPGADPLQWQPLLYRRATSAELAEGTSATAIGTIADIKVMIATFAPTFDGFTKTQSDARYVTKDSGQAYLTLPSAQIRGLGSAAYATLTTSNTDETTNRVLRVGDGGLRGVGVTRNTAALLDATRGCEFFFNDKAAGADNPFGGYGAGVHLCYPAAGLGWDIFARVQGASARAYIRTTTSAGVYNAPVELYHTGNVSPYMQTLMPAADAASARTALGVPAGVDKQMCNAWVNFNGTGTPAIRDSFNVTSITDEGVGLFAVNFTTAMANSNYSVGQSCALIGNMTTASIRSQTAVAMQIRTTTVTDATPGGPVDPTIVNLIVMGGK